MANKERFTVYYDDSYNITGRSDKATGSDSTTTYYDRCGKVMGHSEEFESRNLVSDAGNGILGGLAIALGLAIFYFIGSGIEMAADHFGSITYWLSMLCTYGPAPIGLLVLLWNTRSLNSAVPEVRKHRNLLLGLTAATGLALTLLMLRAYAEVDAAGESMITFAWLFAPNAVMAVVSMVIGLLDHKSTAADIRYSLRKKAVRTTATVTFLTVWLSHTLVFINDGSIGIFMTILCIGLLTALSALGSFVPAAYYIYN